MSSYPLRSEIPSGLTYSGIVRVGNFLLILEVPSQTIIHRALRKQSCAFNFFLPVSFSAMNQIHQSPHRIISWVHKVLSTVRECIPLEDYSQFRHRY